MNIKDIADTAKTALDIANELKNVELKEAILDLKEKLMELREENIQLKEQLSKKNGHNMKFFTEDNCYYDVKDDAKKEGPFCSNCYDAKELYVQMHRVDKGCYCCPNCKTVIHTKEFEEADFTTNFTI